LGVSLAFIGLFNHIPMISRGEVTMRRWAHQSIGIPPFIKELTQNVLRTPMPPGAATPEINPRLEQNAAVRHVMERINASGCEDEHRRLDRIAILSNLMLDPQSPWPSAKVTTRFEHMLDATRADVADLFDDADGAVLLLDTVAQQDLEERDPRKDDQAKRKCRELEAKTTAVHRDLSSVVAVLLENDRVLPVDAHPVLREFTDGIKERSTPGDWLMDKLLFILLSMAAGAFLMTWFATVLGAHEQVANFGPMGTAIFMTTLLVLIFVPASLVGLSYQQRRAELGDWKALRPASGGGTPPVAQYAAAFLGAYVLGVILLGCFYLIFFLNIAGDTSFGVELFLQFIPLYFGMAVLAGSQSVFSAYALAEVKSTDAQARFVAAAAHFAVVIVFLSIFFHSYSALLAGPDENGALVYWVQILETALIAFFATYLCAAPAMTKEHDAEILPDRGSLQMGGAR
jgi:hypothetical protein